MAQSPRPPLRAADAKRRVGGLAIEHMRVAPPACHGHHPATKAQPLVSLRAGCAAPRPKQNPRACGTASASVGSDTAAPGCPDGLCTREGWRRALPGSSSAPGGGAAPSLPPVVALGKFDALHRGHRALAVAAAELGGAPWMVSFSGIAEVLGWPARLPLVAPSDRPRVLAGWAELCGGAVPRECAIPFADVRTMSPEAFVRLLAEELAVAGVVVGCNYRFGYRAAGTAELLQQLGPQHGLQIRVLDLVQGQQGSASSSSTVRAALAEGDMGLVADCLGRPYRLVASLAAGQGGGSEQSTLRVPSGCFSNQAPGPGRYAVRASVAGVDLAAAEVELELDELGLALPALEGTAPGDTLLLDFLPAPSLK